MHAYFHKCIRTNVLTHKYPYSLIYTYIHNRICNYAGKGVIPYIHDFSVTDNYAILFEYPLRLSLDKFLSDKGFFPMMDWLGDKGGKTRIHVFDLNDRLVAYVITMYVQ